MRSPDSDRKCDAYVDVVGGIHADGEEANNGNCAIRPAM